MRVKTKWANSDAQRSIDDTASVLAFNVWKLAAEFLLDIENEGFEVKTYQQRLDIMSEALAWIVQLIDRRVFDRCSESERAQLINSVGLALMNTMQDNRVDAGGEGDYTEAFISLLNARAEDYASCQCENGVPGFVFKRNFGNFVALRVQGQDCRWLPDYVMEVSSPHIVQTLHRIVDRCLPV